MSGSAHPHNRRNDTVEPEGSVHQSIPLPEGEWESCPLSPNHPGLRCGVAGVRERLGTQREHRTLDDRREGHHGPGSVRGRFTDTPPLVPPGCLPKPSVPGVRGGNGRRKATHPSRRRRDSKGDRGTGPLAPERHLTRPIAADRSRTQGYVPTSWSPASQSGGHCCSSTTGGPVGTSSSRGSTWRSRGEGGWTGGCCRGTSRRGGRGAGGAAGAGGGPCSSG